MDRRRRYQSIGHLESVPRENFLSAPSMDCSIFSDDCPVTFTVTKAVPRDSYLLGPLTDRATLSADCPITSNIRYDSSPCRADGGFASISSNPKRSTLRFSRDRRSHWAGSGYASRNTTFTSMVSARTSKLEEGERLCRSAATSISFGVQRKQRSNEHTEFHFGLPQGN